MSLLHSDSLSFFLHVFFPFQESLGDLVPPLAPRGCDHFSDFSLSLMTFPTMRSTGQVFCRLFLDDDLSDDDLSDVSLF